MRRLRLLKAAYLMGFMSAKTLDFNTWDSGPLGWACRMPELRRLGLTLAPLADGTSEPEYDGSYGWEAVARFFGLTEDEALSIFDALAYWDLPRDPVPDDVSQRIRDFVASAEVGR